MTERCITITDVTTGQILAEASREQGVCLFEGAWYFDTEHVDMSTLRITERIYVCPYKGRCKWIDMVTPDKVIENVAWIYHQTLPGYEFVTNKIGFYAGERQATRELS